MSKSLNFKEKLKEYINLLNNGYIPKSIDKEMTFSDGTIIGQFWRYAKDKIKEELEKEEYNMGYEIAKKIVLLKNPKMSIKIEEYIEMINNGYIPRSNDKKTTFKDGSIIGEFWRYNKDKIKEELKKDEYNMGYERVKELVNKELKKLTYEERLKEYINLLNNGYIPKKNDKKTTFSDGTIIGEFWSKNKNKIKEELQNDKYTVGYEIAKKIVLLKNPKMSIKIEEYIEMINNGYIPRSNDKKTTFKDGSIIGEFWRYNKDKIKEELKKDEYNMGYDLAKKVVNDEQKKLTYEERIKEYINLLNNGYMPKSKDKEVTFSDGTFIESFWTKNKDKIKEELEKDKYAIGYDLAKKVVNDKFKNLSFDEKLQEYIEMINNGYITVYNDKETTFKDGSIIGEFWHHHKEKIKEELEKEKFNVGYDLAKEAVKNVKYSKKKVRKKVSSTLKKVIDIFKIDIKELEKYDSKTILKILKLHNIFKTKTFDELLQIVNGKSSWIDLRYKENIEDILTFLNLDSESIIRDMNINIITLKNAIKKEVCKKNIKKEYDFLKEFYYKLINEISINPSEEEISNNFITLIRKLSLEKEEIEVLKKAFISYIKVIKDYYKLDVALTDNFEIKCKKIKKYHLTTEEILDSYYISFEFYNKKLMDRHSEEYYRWQLLRQYMIDWDYYTVEEKEKIKKFFSSEEISILTKRNEEINVLTKK